MCHRLVQGGEALKINLLLDNPKDCLSGYVNIDPLAELSCKDGRIQCDIAQTGSATEGGPQGFDAVCDDAEATEINAIGVLSYFPAPIINDIFAYWQKKLRHGGILRIGDVDLIEVSKATFLGAVTLEDANILLYGEQDKPWRYRKCCMTINQVVYALQNLGYKILKKRVSDNQFIVEAQRP